MGEVLHVTGKKLAGGCVRGGIPNLLTFESKVHRQVATLSPHALPNVLTYGLSASLLTAPCRLALAACEYRNGHCAPVVEASVHKEDSLEILTFGCVDDISWRSSPLTTTMPSPGIPHHPEIAHL
jgi:hypothetical protein